jgi:alpha-beta hydrolase superfamily lysophospholipase
VVPDAFYTPPASVPAEPGRLIRSRPVTTGVADGLQGWLMLYTTTDGDGRPAVSSGTVLAPGERSGEPLPVVAVGHGTTGIMPWCAPSLTPEPFSDGASAALEQTVRAGRVAVMSDYVGLGTAGPHAYLVGPDAAHAVMDSVRAAQELDDLTVGDQVVAWGHSQGGHAVLWTAILAPDYAPELDLLGIAAFAPASDLHALADDLRSASIGKLVAAYIAGSWDEAYPELRVRSQLTPSYRGIVDGITQRCFMGRDVLAALAVASQLSREVFVPGALDGPIGQRLRENSPDGPIRVPVLLAQGDADPLVLPAQQARFAAALCAEGVLLDSRVYPGLDHLTLIADESPLTQDVVTWTQARFDGAPATASCGA